MKNFLYPSMQPVKTLAKACKCEYAEPKNALTATAKGVIVKPIYRFIA
ncbi:MAG: hypothetical protein IKC28_07075 [Clostridia bacterium]|nr:hypothetical protein [Clostridia bacterium]